MQLHTSLSICIAGFPLQRIGSDTNEKYTQFLGIGIDDSLSWKHHIARVNQKVSRALFSIKQLKHIIPYSCLKNLYHALIQPHLSYGISLWGNANRSLLHHTIILQKRAIRTIHNAHYNSHTEPLFKKSKILKFDDLYTFSTLSCMRDYKHDDLPLSFRTMFAHNHDLPHARVTRAMNKFHIMLCRTAFSSKLPFYYFPRVWNDASEVLGDTSRMSRSVFRKFLSEGFLTKYSEKVKCGYLKCKQCFT